MKRLAIISLGLLLQACATIDQAISVEVRYGQLYALEEALTTASRNCDDREATFTATHWATTTVANIDHHSHFLRSDSAERLKSEELVSQLYSLSYHAVSDPAHCQQIALAGVTTRELITLLTQGDS